MQKKEAIFMLFFHLNNTSYRTASRILVPLYKTLYALECICCYEERRLERLMRNHLCILSHSVVSDSFATLWTVAHQVPLSVELSRFPPARILEWVTISSSRGFSCPGIKLASPASPALQVDSLPPNHWGSH